MGVKTDNLPQASVVTELFGHVESGGQKSLAVIEFSKVTSQVSSDLGTDYATLAELQADLNWNAGALARIWGDTPSNNGVYQKTGEAGAGSWTRLGPLPENDLSRSLRVPEGESIDPFPDAATRANTVPMFDATGQPIEGPTAAEITAAEGHAANALASAGAAAASASLAGAPFASRAIAEAANVDAGLNEIKVIHAGEILVYQRDAAGTALTTNDGANWSPGGAKTIKHYGAVGDGVTDDSAAIQAAINDSDGSVLIFNPGGRYLVLTGLTVSDINIVILAFGAILIQGANVVSLSMSASVQTETVATSINNADTVDVSNGAAVTSPVASVTFGSAHSYVVGDLVKVVSDDQWAGSGIAGQFWGEIGRIVAVATNTIYLAKRFVSDVPGSPTNIRVAVLQPFKQELHGLAFDTDAAGDAANWTQPQFQATGLVNPRFRDLEVVKGWAVALEFRGCTEIDAAGISGGNLSNDPSNSRYGYLINDKSGQRNSWRSVTGRICRHVYTTNQDGVSAGSDIRLFGQSIGHNISDSLGADCWADPFDTHHDALNVTFANCTASGAVRGEDATGAGFQARGKGIVFKNIKALGTKYGVHILQQFASDATKDVLVDGLVSDTPAAAVLVSGQSGNPISGIKLKNLNCEVTDHDHVIEGTDCAAHLKNCDLKLAGAVNNARVVSAGSGAVFTVDKTLIDLNDHTGTDPYLFEILAATSDVRTGEVEVTGTWGGIFDLNNADGTAICLKPVIGDAVPTNEDAYINKGADAKLGWDYRIGLVDGSEFKELAAFHNLTYAAAGGQVIDLKYNNADLIIVRVTCTASGVWIDELINMGQRMGQLLTIVNRAGGSTHTLEIRADFAKGLALGSAGKVVADGKGMTLYRETTFYRPTTD